MKYEYRMVVTSTAQGIRTAEQLKEQGWKVGVVGFYTIEFYREKGARYDTFFRR